jgi:hypothetical protein
MPGQWVLLFSTAKESNYQQGSRRLQRSISNPKTNGIERNTILSEKCFFGRCSSQLVEKTT